MISYEDIRQLQDYHSSDDSLILSLYVNVDQTRASNLNRGFETAAENLFRRIAETESEAGNGRLARFESERQRTLRFLREYTPHGKGLVIFSDSSRSLWWQRELQVAVPTEARWSSQPWVRPLLAVLERHDPLVVVVVDTHRARILTLDASGIETQSEISSDVPSRHQTTGTDHIWSQNHMDRGRVQQIRSHARRVDESLAATVDRAKATKLLVAGSGEATSIFTDELPKRFQQMIIGTVSVPFEIGNDRLVEEVYSVHEKAGEQVELRMVETLITSARKGDHAVLGLSETLAASHEGRIHRIVVESAYHVEGSQCNLCEVLVTPGPEKCPFCEGSLVAAPDLINRLSRKVLDQNGKLQAVTGPAAELLADNGHIGAVLRF